MEKGIPCKWKQKESWDSNTLLSDKIEFKTKTVTRDNGSIQEKDTILNTYAFNIRAPKYIKQILTDIMGKMNSNTILLGGSNMPLVSMDKSPRQKNHH